MDQPSPEPDPVLAAIDKRVRQKAACTRGLLLVFSVWLVVYAAICLDQTLSWTETAKGFANGVMLGWLLGAFSLIWMLPLGLLCVGIVHLTPWRSRRRWFMLAPPLLLLGYVAVARGIDRVRPSLRFERAASCPLPSSATKLHYEWSGGLFADITEVYSFECDPAETKSLIQSMDLHREEDAASHIIGGPGGGFSPSSSAWPDAERWSGEIQGWDFFEFHTDHSKTRVRMVFGTI